MIPSEPNAPNIAVTFATTLISPGMNGMLPSPRTSRMIARAAMLTPTSASAETLYLIKHFHMKIPPSRLRLI